MPTSITTYRDFQPKYKNSTLTGYDIVTDIEAVRNSLRNLFLVNKTELPGKPAFGNPLKMKLFDLFDSFTETTIASAIQNEVELFEPRVNVLSVNVIKNPEYNRIIIDITYEVMIYDTLYRDNLYIPFSHDSLTYVDMRPERVI